MLPPDEAVPPTIVIQAWPVIAVPVPRHLERGPPPRRDSAVRRDPTESAGCAQDHVAGGIRLRATGGAPSRRGRRAVPHGGRPVYPRRRAPTCSWSGRRPTGSTSSRRRRSTARSCPARPVHGCSAGPGASGCDRSKGMLSRADLAAADEAFLSLERRRGPAGDPFRWRPDRDRTCPDRGRGGRGRIANAMIRGEDAR